MLMVSLLCVCVQVSRAVRDSLTVRAADFGIVLEDIAITHLSFGSEFTKVRHMHPFARRHLGPWELTQHSEVAASWTLLRTKSQSVCWLQDVALWCRLYPG